MVEYFVIVNNGIQLYPLSFKLKQVVLIHDSARIRIDPEEAEVAPLHAPVVLANQVVLTLFILVVANEGDVEVDAAVVGAAVNNLIAFVIPEFVV